MDLTLLPSKKTVAKWESGLLVIAQGNSVVELTPEQAIAMQVFISETVAPRMISDERKDHGQ